MTRVGSEPMLAELVTRSYFWRRAYLFDDRERAKPSLGPADETTASVRLTPIGGNELVLVFDRRTGALAARALAALPSRVRGPTRYRDLSRLPVDAARSRGPVCPRAACPTRRRAAGTSSFTQPFAEAPFQTDAGGISDRGARLRRSRRVSRSTPTPTGRCESRRSSRRASVSPRPPGRVRTSHRRGRHARDRADLDGRNSTSRCWRSAGAGIDAVAGGVLYRETVVEIDPASGNVRSTIRPDGSRRRDSAAAPLDDDGTVPVAILSRSGRRVRLRLGTRSSSPLLVPASGGIGDGATPVAGLVWGTLRFPPLPADPVPSRFDPAWGDDGALGIPCSSSSTSSSTCLTDGFT